MSNVGRTALVGMLAVSLVGIACSDFSRTAGLARFDGSVASVEYNYNNWSCWHVFYPDSSESWGCAWTGGSNTFTMMPEPSWLPSSTPKWTDFSDCAVQRVPCGGDISGAPIAGGPSSVPDDTGWPEFQENLNDEDQANWAVFDCRIVRCPTPAQILASENVRKVAALLKSRTVATGNEWGAWLYMNADGTIRVGPILQGNPTSIPALAYPPDQFVVGSIHSHPPGGTWRQGLPSNPDINNAIINGIYVLVIAGNGSLHVWPDPSLPGWKGPGPAQSGSCAQPPC